MKTSMEEHEMQDKPLNEKESLEIITRMIQNTQQKLERVSAAPMLIWGYATIVAAITVWIVLALTSDYRSFYLWFLIPVIGTTCMLLRKKQPKGVSTYVDKVIRYIWIVLGVVGFLLSVATIFKVMWSFNILFVIIIIMGMGTVLTGLVVEYKPMIIGGIIGLIISIPHQFAHGYDIIISGIKISSYDLMTITFVLAFVVMYIIPGHILNYRAKKACLKN